MEDIEKPFSTRRLAERWECSEQHVRDLIQNGDLNHFRIGRLIRIPYKEVEQFEAIGDLNCTEENTMPLQQLTDKPSAAPFVLRTRTKPSNTFEIS